MNRNILAVSCLAFGVLGGSCNRSSRPSITRSPYLTVEELLANPESHSHSMVTVTGCYMYGFEVSILWSCGIPKSAQEKIWVERAGRIEDRRRSNQRHRDRRRPTEPKLLFEYDEARNSLVWKKLLGQEQVSEVVLLGQFEHDAPYAMDANELILVDVLSSRPTKVEWMLARNQEAEPEPKLPPDYIESLRKRNLCEQRFYDKKIFSVHGMSVMEACRENPDRQPQSRR